MSNEVLDPQEFIDSYGSDASVVVGKGVGMSLGQALEAEKLLCPKGSEVREDPAKRLGYLASMLHAGGSLLPEHEHLLGEG